MTCSVDVTKCHACHPKCRCMSPSATPATQSEGQYRQVPHACYANSRGHNGFNREPSVPPEPAVHVHVTKCHAVAKCHACHANSCGRNQAGHESQPSAISATPVTQSARPCHQVPRLPRKVKVDVAKCHACYANSRGGNSVNWEPTAPPEPAVHVHVTKCHAVAKCHACQAK